MIAHQQSSDLSQVLSALAEPKRREIVYALQESSGNPVDLDALLADVAARTQVTRDQLDVECYHCHLPLLANVGILEYDVDSQQVWFRDTPVLETVVEACREFDE